MGNAKLDFQERRVLAIFRRGARRGESKSIQMVNWTRASSPKNFRQRGIPVTSSARDEVLKREKRRGDERHEGGNGFEDGTTLGSETSKNT